MFVQLPKDARRLATRAHGHLTSRYAIREYAQLEGDGKQIGWRVLSYDMEVGRYAREGNAGERGQLRAVMGEASERGAKPHRQRAKERLQARGAPSRDMPARCAAVEKRDRHQPISLQALARP